MNLIVQPVVRVERGGLGWATSVEIVTPERDALPFLRLELSQPPYCYPPPLRIVTEADRAAALGQAFASLLFDRVQRPFSRPGLSRCTVHGFHETEVTSRPR